LDSMLLIGSSFFIERR